MKKWYYRAAIVSIPVFLAFLSIGCKKTKTSETKKMTEPDKWLHFVVQMSTDSLDLNRNEDQNTLDRWAEQSKEILNNRIKVFGYVSSITRDPVNRNRLVVKTPYIDGKHEENVKFLLSGRGLIEWKLVLSGPFLSKEAILDAYGGSIPDNSQIATGPGCYLVSREAVISNEDVKDAAATTDSSGDSSISITLNAKGGEKMLRFSSENIGKNLAVVCDGTGLLVVAGIEGKISAKVALHGNFAPDEALIYSSILKLPALPAPVQILEEKIEEGKR